jgi:hypothetical protein
MERAEAHEGSSRTLQRTLDTTASKKKSANESGVDVRGSGKPRTRESQKSTFFFPTEVETKEV